MRAAFIILACLLFYASGAQTSISGIVNSYYKVVEVIPAKSCLRVDNPAGLALNDLIAIFQMKGAAITTINNSSYGSVSSLQNAGNYELGTVCTVRGDSVFLFKTLAQNYTVTDKVQLVRIPQYVTAVVTDTLKAQAWDSTSGKGGVLAVFVSGDLTLNAPVVASGTGYRGGAFVISSSSCSNIFAADNYAYDPTNTSPQDGAWKGESVASLSNANNGGKGAAANGGGGGNNHNNGGGGGANTAAGGAGGGNSSATGCSASNPARGGYALSNNGGLKAFLGGGGGAGHANSGTSSTGGGAGGGILFIHAGNLVSNGYKILSNGIDGGSTLGDGASGGGAGGTMILDINAYADAVNIEAKGGNGGNENDDFISQRCYAEGGGGSGGAVYFKTLAPAGVVSVNGGIKGLRLNSLNCGTIVAGANGNNGVITANYNYVQSSTLSGTCAAAALPVDIIRFDLSMQDPGVLLHWTIATSNELRFFEVERRTEDGNWKVLKTIENTASTEYYFTDRSLTAGIYYYRIRCHETSGKERFSVVRAVQLAASHLIAYPNPSVGHINLSYTFKKGAVLQLFDSEGRLVKKQEFVKDLVVIAIDLSGLPKGRYFAQVGNDRTSFLLQ